MLRTLLILGALLIPASWNLSYAGDEKAPPAAEGEKKDEKKEKKGKKAKKEGEKPADGEKKAE